MINHSADPICLYCEVKLLSARPEVAEFFRAIKVKYPDIHCSWTFRNAADQEQFFKSGLSQEHFPHSKHNKTDKDGKPCSQAVDIFQINADHPKGLWDAHFCKQIYEEFKPNFPWIVWGGSWRHPSDSDHYEIEVNETGSICIPI